MIIYGTRAKLKIEKVELAKACNKCGREYVKGKREDQDPVLGNQYHKFGAGGGYGTHYPQDLCSIEFDLCSWCLEEFVGTFKHPPTETGSGWTYRNPASLTKATHTESKDEVVVYQGRIYHAAEPNWDDVFDLTEEELEKYPWPEWGVHRHYKGGHYYTIGLAMDGEVPVIVYTSLYGKTQNWVRPLSSWNEPVDGQPRFTHLPTPTDDEGGE